MKMSLKKIFKFLSLESAVSASLSHAANGNLIRNQMLTTIIMRRKGERKKNLKFSLDASQKALVTSIQQLKQCLSYEE